MPEVVHDEPNSLPGLRVLSIALPSDPQDPYLAWVVDPVSALIEHLRHRTDGQRLAVMVECSVTRTEQQEAGHAAAVQALRGLVQSLAKETAGTWAPINLLITGDNDRASTKAALEFLAGDGGAFTAGATLDLTGRTWA